MTDPDDRAVSPASPLQEVWPMLVRIAGTIAGAASLTFGIGFVLVNLSLLKHGVYEGALVRERYIAAGISYLAVLFSAILIAQAGYWLVDRLPNKWSRPVRIVVAVALTPVMEYLLALVVWAGGRVPPKLARLEPMDRLLALQEWGLKGLRFFNLALLVWALVAGWLSALLLHADRIHWARKFLFRQDPLLTPSPQPPEPSGQASTRPDSVDGTLPALGRARSPAYLTALAILFFLQLFTYAQYVYDTLPAALGGGLPVVVQFTGDEEGMTLLSGMGVSLEDPTTTGQLELIGQTDSRYIVFVWQISWEKPYTGTMPARVITHRTVLAFDKELIKGVQYYPSEYYMSDEYAAITHYQQGNDLYDNGYYDGAIREYGNAINRWVMYGAAYHYRGRAHLALALEGFANEAELAVSDFKTARDLEPGNAEYWFHLARAQVLADRHEEAVETLSMTVDQDPAYCDLAREEPLFKELRAREDLGFSFEIIVFGSKVKAARAYADQGQVHYAAAQEASEEEARGKALDQAAQAYTQAISLTSSADLPLEQASYRVGLAAIYQDQELSDLAVIQLEQAVDAAPENEVYHLQLARAYADQVRWNEALREYEAVLDLNGENVSAWMGKGEALFEQGKASQAAQAFEQAGDLAPEEADAWYGLMVARLAFDPNEAVAPLRQAVTLDPAYIAIIRQDLKEAELAGDVGEKLESVLQAADEVIRGDDALARDDLVQAVDYYEDAVEADPDNTVFLVKLGDAYRKLGDEGVREAYVQAATTYHSVIERVPGEPSYYFRLATVYAAPGEDASALIALKTAITLDPDVAAYYAARAPLYIRSDRIGDAISDYEQAISLEPGNHLYHGQLAKVYYEQAQYDEAIDALNTAISLEPGNYLYHGQLAKVYYEQTQYDEAIDALNTAISLNPQYALGFYHLGLVHLTIGDVDAARIAFATCTGVAQEETQRSQCQEQLTPLTTPTP